MRAGGGQSSTAALQFAKGGAKVVGMVSSEGEKFDFRTPQPTEGAVELWLGLVEAQMSLVSLALGLGAFPNALNR